MEISSFRRGHFLTENQDPCKSMLETSVYHLLICIANKAFLEQASLNDMIIASNTVPENIHLFLLVNVQDHAF